MKQETSIQWLERVAAESESSQARKKAKQAISEWRAMTQYWKESGLRVRRSLWDLLAGVSERGGKIVESFDAETVVKTGGRTFKFPVFVEAVRRRSRDVKSAPGAVETGISPQSFRTPQTTKWGSSICKT